VKLPDRFRLTLPLALLLASIGVVSIASFQAMAAVRSHRRLADETLQDYTAFAAWSFRQHLKDELFDAAASVLQPVNHGNGLHESPRVPDAADLAHLLPWDALGCWCHTATYPPRYFFAFTLGHEDLDVTTNIFIRPDRGVVVDTPAALEKWRLEELPRIPAYDAATRRWIADTLATSVRHEFRIDWQYGIVIGRHNGNPHFFAYRPMATVWGDTLVYAFELPPRQLARLFGSLIDQSDLLPEALTRNYTNREMMAVEIHDRDGDVVYRSDPGRSLLDRYREDRVPDALGGFTVRAAIRPEVANALVIGGLPRSRLPLLVGLLTVAAALAVVAVQQLRRAAALTRMRADFVAAISHELRTPLSQIRLYLDTLRLGRLSTEKERTWSLDHLDREATRLGNLVENVLRFASIGQQRTSPREVCDVSAEVMQTVTSFEPLARSGRATVRTDVQPRIEAPLARDAFRVAIHNLLDNAVKYGPAGQTITVMVRLEGHEAVVTVEDQGEGVDPEDREAIWQPFRRGRDGAARAVGGSGIGLSIVRDVIDHHGGHTHVEPAGGGGARFVLGLPGATQGRPMADGATREGTGPEELSILPAGLP
jgi:signal transduction histidine kinase